MLPALYAAILAEATNLGLAAMAQASGMSVGQLQRAVDWYLREETLREAITRLIQYHRSLVQPHGTVIMRRTSGMGPGTGTRGRVRARTVARGGVRPVP